MAGPDGRLYRQPTKTQCASTQYGINWLDAYMNKKPYINEESR